MDANMISAKIIKAEMMGDMDRVAELKLQLEKMSNKSDSNQNTRPDQKHRSQQRNTTDELNKLNAKLIKAEMMGDDDRVNEIKSQIDDLRKQGEQRGGQRRGHFYKTRDCQAAPDDLNKLNAKLLKAEMHGDLIKIQEIKSQLEELKNPKEPRPSSPPLSRDTGPTNEPQRNVKLIQLAKKITDDRLSLKQMFVKAKRGEVEDEAKLFIASSSKLLNVDDEYDEVKKKKKKREEKEVFERIPLDDNEQECEMCIPRIKKHLIVAIKDTVYLCLPQHEPFVPAHCYIRSRNHVRCTVEAEENCLLEINTLRKRLCEMFDAQNLGVVFTELFYKRTKDQHFQIECFPIKKKYMADVKMYFKKAIMECETEWSMNKKLVDMKNKCITKSLPKGLPYFWVSFGPTPDSYGHVIEDEQYFPKHFAYEVIAGLLDIDRFRYTKPKNESFDQQYDRVTKFKSVWKKYDKLDEVSITSDD